MTTTTTPLLADVLEQRWRTGAQKSDSAWPNDVAAGVQAFVETVLGAYWQYDDGDTLEADTPLAPEWLAALEADLVATGTDAWERHVLPALTDVVARHLLSAPRHLVEFPGSEQLRADLATDVELRQ